MKTIDSKINQLTNIVSWFNSNNADAIMLITKNYIAVAVTSSLYDYDKTISSIRDKAESFVVAELEISIKALLALKEELEKKTT